MPSELTEKPSVMTALETIRWIKSLLVVTEEPRDHHVGKLSGLSSMESWSKLVRMTKVLWYETEE